jgi:iron complex outermembrane recepter protein
MKKLFLLNSKSQKIGFFGILFMLINVQIIAQTITGKVSTAAGDNLPGVSVVIKGSTKGTTTDNDGKYSIDAAKSAKLVFSFIGYINQEISVGENTIINVSLEEASKALDEVVVTGLFDERKRMEASVSISTINTTQLERLAAGSGAELLKNIPGIFVNSSAGEIRSSVYTRGLANRPSYNEDVSGLYYVSMQEDGLPISNIYLSTYTHDLFLRADANVNRLEAVRGGTASIAGANAPGGIFNYISKTGGNKLEGMVRQKFGLEADGRNFYTRTEANIGGPLAKGWTYNIGGFYRHGKGARVVAYPLNYGGQLKANIQKKYDKGSVTFYAKYLNDHNGTFMNLIGSNFDSPELSSRFSKNKAFILPTSSKLSTKTGDGKVLDFDPTKLNHSRETSFGMNWKHDLGNSFAISNNARYSAKNLQYNITQATAPANITTVPINGSMGTIAPGAGTITYKDNLTKQVLATTIRTPGPPVFTMGVNNLPNNDLIPNSLLYTASLFGAPKVNEFFDQLVLSKKTEKFSFNLGTFIGISNLARYTAGIAGGSLITMEENPRMVDISHSSPAGVVTQITSPEGYFKTGGFLGINDFEYKKSNIAPFFAASYHPNQKLTLDFGVRYENTTQSGVNYRYAPNTVADGGFDKNPLTTFDNNYYKPSLDIPYEFKNATWSYSGAANYLISDKQSVYARYSVGRKAPEASAFTGIDSKALLDLTQSIPQDITQFELGYKFRNDKVDLAVTPFYSLLSNVYTAAGTLGADNVIYLLQPFYNSLESKGVEIEGNINFTKKFSTRIAATFQGTSFPEYKVAIPGATTAKTDDAVVDYSGNKGDLTPNTILNITPTYSTDKFYVYLSYQYTGARWANAPNAFQMPAFSQIDLGLGYDITKNIALSANINNLTNSFGMMTWGAPGGFPAVYSTNAFSPAQRDANKGAFFPMGGTQPRAYFLTATYRF